MFDDDSSFEFKSLFSPLTTKKVIIWIVFLGLLVYFNALFGQFVWDDNPQIVNNNVTHSILNLWIILLDHSSTYYRPFASIIYSFIYTVFGAVPFWYHLVQISIHILNTILFYLILRKSSGKTSSFILSLFFLVHPINVEAVSYISSLQINLSMLFGLLVLLLVLNQKMKPLHKYGLIFILLFFSLLSKETGVVFLILLPLYVIANLGKIFLKRDYLSLSIPIFLSLFFYLFLRFFITKNVNSIFINQSPVPIMTLNLSERLINIPKIISFYLETIIFPRGLAISQNWVIKVADTGSFLLPFIIDLLFFIILFGFGIFLLIKKSKQLLFYLFFLTWFLLSWVIHWNIIPLDMTVAERWFYFAFAGLLGLIGVLINSINIKHKGIRTFTICISVLIVVLLSIRTIVRNENWNTPLNLYSHDSQISVESFDLENSYAKELLAVSRFDESLPHIKKSIQLAPKYWVNWGNLGVYYQNKGMVDKSIGAFNTSIINNNNYYMAYANLSRIYFYYKSPNETESFLKKALLQFPRNSYFLYLDSITKFKLGNKQAALDEILDAYQQTKDENLLNIYNQMKQ